MVLILKKVISILCFFLAFQVLPASAHRGGGHHSGNHYNNYHSKPSVKVSSYTRSNGIPVKGHHRTHPDYTKNNNYSTKGNTNPYTGKEGWISRSYN